MEDRPTLDELDEQLLSVNDWSGLGSRLNISDNSLSEIRLKYSGVRECRREVLSLWLRSNFMNASRSAVADALHGIGEHAVANQYSEYVQTLPTTRHLDIGPRPRREGGFEYAKAETETQINAGRSAFVSISNNPTINVKTNVVHSDAKPHSKSTKQSRNMFYICIVAVLVLCCFFLFFNRSMNDIETQRDKHESIPIKPIITIDNPETVIATKLIEITDLYLLASCLGIKNSKAKVDQLQKDHRGKQQHIRIDIIDIWLKDAEQRYWEELLEPLQHCLNNKRLAKSLEDAFMK